MDRDKRNALLKRWSDFARFAEDGQICHHRFRSDFAWHLTFQANMNSVHCYGVDKRETEPVRPDRIGKLYLP